jgi:hypothetical protein
MTPRRPIRDTGRSADFSDIEPSIMVANDLAVWRALELAGVEFIDENGRGLVSAFAKACRKNARSPASDYLSGAMLIEDVRHHYGHHHYDEGPDLATGAL